MGTVPKGKRLSSRIALRISGRAPPRLKSISVSAPLSSATIAFFSSCFSVDLSSEVLILALTFVRKPLPTPQTFIFLPLLFARITMLPAATPSLTNSPLTPSLRATSCISLVILPFFASVLCIIRKTCP